MEKSNKKYYKIYWYYIFGFHVSHVGANVQRKSSLDSRWLGIWLAVSVSASLAFLVQPLNSHSLGLIPFLGPCCCAQSCRGGWPLTWVCLLQPKLGCLLPTLSIKPSSQLFLFLGSDRFSTCSQKWLSSSPVCWCRLVKLYSWSWMDEWCPMCVGRWNKRNPTTRTLSDHIPDSNTRKCATFFFAYNALVWCVSVIQKITRNYLSVISPVFAQIVLLI